MNDARRRLLIAGGALLAPSTLFAQAKGPKVTRIGLLTPASSSSAKRNIEPFKQRLQELNYVEGRNMVIDALWAEGDQAKLAGFAKDLVRRNADVIVAAGTSGVQAAKAATSTIPIVGAAVGDLTETGLIESIAKPGGNLTGVAVVFPETATKQLEMMLEVMPNKRRVAVLWSGPRNSIVQRQRKELEEAGATTRLELTWHTAHMKSDLEPVFGAIQIFRPDFLVVMTDPINFGNRREVAAFAAKARLPAVYGFREYVEEGGLMSYGANIAQSFRSAADYVNRILKGANPGDLPVQMPAKLDLAVNISAARAVNLSFPRVVLARADLIVP
jgi:putative ABC transport system substrate-binding protein